MKADESLLVKPCMQTHPLCQQNMRGCRPTFDTNPKSIFLGISIFSLACALLTFLLSLKVEEFKVRYDDKCDFSVNGSQVQVNFGNPELSNAYIYFELHGYYQNHFRMANSFSQDQLLGKYVEDPSSCSPANKSLAPCGLLPQGFFTDTLTIPENFTDSGITWKNEVGKLFVKINSQYKADQQWMETDFFRTNFPGGTENEHFVQWMRISMHPDFRKLYARFDQNENRTVPADITVNVTCNYPNETFSGERYVVLMKNGGMGGKNLFIAYANFALFGLNLIFGLLFFCPCIRRNLEMYSEMSAEDEEMLIS
ncbi:cell cycle control protein [Histomonas meleagridis]|uniref:cell cycle control protein n=1 Tax=Histomonas meleagridis TaxID=135588 RepID=UPI00355A91DE|nr:cell cycle control protein [Histomonas meleagridis]KAH0804126.1 cell cycle control protein [Histomonas meleagridis]